MANRRTGGEDVSYYPPMAWTGGGEIVATRRTIPKSMRALRPHDYRAQMKVHRECISPLKDEYHLGTPEQIGKSNSEHIKFLQWIQQIKKECEDRGLDHVFRVTIDAQTERYLFDKMGYARAEIVTPWVTHLITRQPVDPYDLEALDWSAKFLMASLTVEMHARVERDVPPGAFGPTIFAAIVNIHQSLTVSAQRQLVDKLMKLRITKEPGENVDSFGDKVSDLAKQIEGAGKPPDDLVTLIYKCFQGVTNDLFQAAARDLYSKANRRDPNVNNWEEQLVELKTLYREQKDLGEWEAVKHQKEKELAAMKAELQAIKSKMGATTANPKSAAEKTCYHCGKPGHIKPNCPDKNKPAVKSGAGAPTVPAANTNSSSGQKVPDPKKIPPAGNEKEERTRDGVFEKWCKTCKSWTSGSKLHDTATHVKGKGKANGPTGNLGEIESPDAPAVDPIIAGGLRFVGGYHGEIYDEAEELRQGRLNRGLDELLEPIPEEEDAIKEMHYRHAVILLNRPAKFEHVTSLDHEGFANMLEDLVFDRYCDRYNENAVTEAVAKTLSYLSDDDVNRDPDLDDMVWVPEEKVWVPEEKENWREKKEEASKWVVVSRRRKQAPIQDTVDCCESPMKRMHLNSSAGQC